MGRIHPIKRYDWVVDILGRLRRQHADLALLLVGNDAGHLSVIEKVAARHGLGDSFVHAGFLEGRLKEGALALAHVLVQPSIHENFGIAVLEAMARGVPVIVTPGVASHAYVDRSKAGLTVEANPEAIAAALRQILASDREAIGGRGRQFVRQNLSWPVVASQIDEMYQSMLAEAEEAR
jgi:glycosyltransferase involved in cell wall biosynthesis